MNPVIFVFKAFRALLIPKYRFYYLSGRGFYLSMPDDEYIKRMFRYKLGYNLNLDNPQTFSEKIQWLKLYNRQQYCTDFADKYKAKSLVGSIIGTQYIIPCYGVWNSFDEIDFDSLPDKFILKCNHDSGGYIICKDKRSLDHKAAREKLTRCLRKNYYYFTREWSYKNIKPVIFAEEYLENEQGKGLHDYKVWCFNGHAEYIQYISGRQEKEIYGGFYDREWNLQPFMFDHPLPKEPVPRPERLEELISCAEKLANGSPFVRSDFYVLEDGSIRFGEMTFYPCAGLHRWITDGADLEIGQKINLDDIRRTSRG